MLLALDLAVFADDLTGPVVFVLDGDPIEILHNQQPERIRLSGIDCPERDQAYGKHATHAASALVFGKEVIVQSHGKDKYKRTIGELIQPHETNVNQELITQGWCRWYRNYTPRDTVLEGLEMEAREWKRGLWADPQPMPPWEWRRLRRSR